jgi:hypothetical protein
MIAFPRAFVSLAEVEMAQTPAIDPVIGRIGNLPDNRFNSGAAATKKIGEAAAMLKRRQRNQNQLFACSVVLLLVSGCSFMLSSCGGSGDASAPGSSALTLNLDFTRNTSPADGSFKAVVWLSNQSGALVPFASVPTLTSTRGSVSALSLRGDGKHEATITPDAQKTGEYTVMASATVSGNSVAVAHTAIVMEQVASGWGQPFSVDGLVNTGGTQDSLAISPDGQYLFLQYYPITLTCLITTPYDVNSIYCRKPRGPVAAPQRPNMPGASRVDYGTDSVHHGCPSLNFDPSPFPVPPIALYGFRRQADGSYAEPFVFMFTGNDGCFAPWGPSLRANGNGTYRAFVSFNDPRNAGTTSDFAHVYDFNFSPGSTQVLGNVSLNGAGAVQINNFILNQATFAGADVHRGNPHVHYSGNTPSLLFYDDETKPAAGQYIYVSSWTGSGWGAATELSFFNTTGFGDTQPYFDGTQLILRNGLQLLTYAYNGGAPGSASSWSAPTVLLAPGSSLQSGSVIVVGEPTVATIDAQQVLFFIYGIYQADGSINLRAGYVRKGA